MPRTSGRIISVLQHESEPASTIHHCHVASGSLCAIHPCARPSLRHSSGPLSSSRSSWTFMRRARPLPSHQHLETSISFLSSATRILWGFSRVFPQRREASQQSSWIQQVPKTAPMRTGITIDSRMIASRRKNRSPICEKAERFSRRSSLPMILNLRTPGQSLDVLRA